jgi:hypothetical protein
MCNIRNMWFNESVTVFVSRSVARKRRLEPEYPSACETVNCRCCRQKVALYWLWVNVIKSKCVTQMLMNPINQTRNPLINGVYHPTLHNMLAQNIRLVYLSEVYIALSMSDILVSCGFPFREICVVQLQTTNYIIIRSYA